MRVIGWTLFALMLFSGVGAVFGLIFAKPDTFTHQAYGTVPAHHCVVDTRWRCGLFYNETGNVIEVSNGYRAPRLQWSAQQRKYINVTPGRPVLTSAQVDAAFASRDLLFREAHLENAVLWAGYGAIAWIYAMAGFLVFVFAKPTLNLFRRTGTKVASAGKSAHALTRSFTDTAALKADVRKKELLARKAVAEATLNRQDPDVLRHDVAIRRSRS